MTTNPKGQTMPVQYSQIIGNQLQPIMRWEESGDYCDLYHNPNNREFAYQVGRIDQPGHNNGGFLGHMPLDHVLTILDRYVDLEHMTIVLDLTNH